MFTLKFSESNLRLFIINSLLMLTLSYLCPFLKLMTGQVNKCPVSMASMALVKSVCEKREEWSAYNLDKSLNVRIGSGYLLGYFVAHAACGAAQGQITHVQQQKMCPLNM